MTRSRIHIGTHVIADVDGVESACLTNVELLMDTFRAALTSEGARILETASHVFPHTNGVTGVFMLAESHATFHSWPEYSLLCLDVFSCGLMRPEIVLEKVLAGIPYENVKTLVVARSGVGSGPTSQVNGGTQSCFSPRPINVKAIGDILR